MTPTKTRESRVIADASRHLLVIGTTMTATVVPETTTTVTSAESMTETGQVATETIVETIVGMTEAHETTEDTIGHLGTTDHQDQTVLTETTDLQETATNEKLTVLEETKTADPEVQILKSVTIGELIIVVIGRNAIMTQVVQEVIPVVMTATNTTPIVLTTGTTVQIVTMKMVATAEAATILMIATEAETTEAECVLIMTPPMSEDTGRTVTIQDRGMRVAMSTTKSQNHIKE
jgi:hypothetical protein